MNIDTQISLFLNSFIGKKFLFDFSIIFFSKVAIYFLGFALFVFLLLSPNEKEHLVRSFIFWNTVFFGVGLATLNLIFGVTAFRARPFLTIGTLPLIQVSLTDQSFPSVHATIAFLIAGVFYAIDNRKGIFFFFVAFLIALARVVAGVHFFSDVVVGALLGIFAGWIMKKWFIDYL